MEWKEADSPSIPVAELTLDREIDIRDIRSLRFTPGHFIPEHRPLGNLGRGRIFTYESSQTGRHADIDEPDENRFFGSWTRRSMFQNTDGTLSWTPAVRDFIWKREN